jgi:hypothetical protein
LAGAKDPRHPNAQHSDNNIGQPVFDITQFMPALGTMGNARRRFFSGRGK